MGSERFWEVLSKYSIIIRSVNIIIKHHKQISATVPIGTPGRVWGVVLLSDDLVACLALILLLVWLVLRAPPPYSGLLKFAAALFSTPFFSQRLFPKVSKLYSPKSLKTLIFCKISALKRTHDQDLGKNSVSKRSNLWNWQLLHTFSCF